MAETDVARTCCRWGHDGTATRPPLRTIRDRDAGPPASSLRHDLSRRSPIGIPDALGTQANPSALTDGLKSLVRDVGRS